MRRFETASWIEPLDTAGHRQRVLDALRRDRRYEPRSDYDRAAIPAYLDAIDDMRRLVEHDVRAPLRDAVLINLDGRVRRATALSAGNDEAYSFATA